MMSYQKMSDGHLLSDKIEQGEVFPVGGTFLGKNDIFVQVDVDSFQDFFGAVARCQKTLEKNDALKRWFSKVKTDLDYSLFCHLYAFTPTLRKIYGDVVAKKGQAHTDFYASGITKKLSEAVQNKKCMCTEFALLAQLYFQSQNIPTRYVVGELAVNGHFDACEAHSFIVFQNHQKEYVYDPVNQLDSQLPRIAVFVGKRDNFFLETKGLFNGDKWFYAGGEKGEFLRDLPTLKTVQNILKTASQRTNLKKDKTND